MKQPFFFNWAIIAEMLRGYAKKMTSQTIRLFLAIEFLTVNYELTQNRNSPRGYESCFKFEWLQLQECARCTCKVN